MPISSNWSKTVSDHWKNISFLCSSSSYFVIIPHQHSSKSMQLQTFETSFSHSADFLTSSLLVESNLGLTQVQIRSISSNSWLIKCPLKKIRLLAALVLFFFDVIVSLQTFISAAMPSLCCLLQRGAESIPACNQRRKWYCKAMQNPDEHYFGSETRRWWLSKLLRNSNSNKSIVYLAVTNHTSVGVRTASQIHHTETFDPGNQSELQRKIKVDFSPKNHGRDKVCTGDAFFDSHGKVRRL